MQIRDVLAGLGVAIGMLGIGLAIAPAVGAGIDLSVIPIQFVGFAAILLAIVGYMARRRAVFSEGDPPDVESPPDLGRPGRSVDDSLQTASGVGLLGQTERRALSDRLRELAVEVIATTEGCDEATAREMLRAGTWTDDLRAVSLFGEDPPSTPMRDVLSGIISGRSQFVVQATHVIEALRERMEGES